MILALAHIPCMVLLDDHIMFPSLEKNRCRSHSNVDRMHALNTNFTVQCDNLFTDPSVHKLLTEHFG